MAGSSYSKIIMSAQSVDETTSDTIGGFSTFKELAFYVAWSSGVSAGVVTIESAPNATYTGTWAPLAVVTYTSGSPKCDLVQVSGTGLAFRARISTAITGGTVTVTFLGN